MPLHLIQRVRYVSVKHLFSMYYYYQLKIMDKTFWEIFIILILRSYISMFYSISKCARNHACILLAMIA